MVDNRGITSISGVFKADNASANKMSEEKQGQGGEYFAQEMIEEEDNQTQQNPYHDRSAQLRASLDSLAMMNAGSINFKKIKEKKKLEEKNKKETESLDEEIEESVFDE